MAHVEQSYTVDTRLYAALDDSPGFSVMVIGDEPLLRILLL